MIPWEGSINYKNGPKGVQYANDLMTYFKLIELANRTLVRRAQHQFVSIPPDGILKHFRHCTLARGSNF